MNLGSFSEKILLNDIGDSVVLWRDALIVEWCFEIRVGDLARLKSESAETMRVECLKMSELLKKFAEAIDSHE